MMGCFECVRSELALGMRNTGLLTARPSEEPGVDIEVLGQGHRQSFLNLLSCKITAVIMEKVVGAQHGRSFLRPHVLGHQGGRRVDPRPVTRRIGAHGGRHLTADKCVDPAGYDELPLHPRAPPCVEAGRHPG